MREHRQLSNTADSMEESTMRADEIITDRIIKLHENERRGLAQAVGQSPGRGSVAA
jgi:hypothetical protein